MEFPLHVVSFSTGLSSALTVERVLERYGPSRTRVIFCDTKIEDEDNYRFLRECRTRWGIEITVLEDGRSPYQVFEDNHVIPNHRVAPCTNVLKTRLASQFMAGIEGDWIHYVGFDYSELHRVEASKKKHAEKGWKVDFPLLWKPYEFRPYSDVVKYDWGIEPPRMYSLGYSHANCGGVCVKQGWGDWARTLINFPERYAEAEEWEKRMRQHPVRKNYAILQDRASGERTPLTLEEFRKRQEEKATEPTLFDLDPLTSVCVVCGVGDLSET